MLNRHHFLGTVGAGAISSLNAQSTYEWGNPVLDIHVHPRVGGGIPNIIGRELASRVCSCTSAPPGS